MAAEREYLTLEDTLALIVRHRVLFLTVLMAVLAISTSYAFLIDPIYRAETLLVPVAQGTAQSEASALDGLGLRSVAALAGFNLAPQDSSNEYMAVLTSYSFLAAFVEDENLMTELFHRDWDEGKKSWRNDPPELWDAYRLLIEDVITVNRDENTGLVALSVEWRNPELAARWANILVQRLNARTRARAIAEAEKSMTYLQSERDKTSIVGIQQGINGLIEDQINQIMLANVRDEFAFRVIDSAIPPSEDDYVRPIRWLYVLAGCILGVVLGSFSAGLRARFLRNS